MRQKRLLEDAIFQNKPGSAGSVGSRPKLVVRLPSSPNVEQLTMNLINDSQFGRACTKSSAKYAL